MKRKYNNILVVSLTCLIGLLGINLLEQDNMVNSKQNASYLDSTIEIVEDPNPDGVTLLDMNPIIDTNLLDL